jgi:hypothetical protein
MALVLLLLSSSCVEEKTGSPCVVQIDKIVIHCFPFPPLQIFAWHVCPLFGSTRVHVLFNGALLVTPLHSRCVSCLCDPRD